MTDTARLVATADRLNELAETAELMGDQDTANTMRDRAGRMRMAAMDLMPPPPPDTVGRRGLR
jgi:hypothetical protein